MNWTNLLNAESKEGWWDFFNVDGVIRLCKFDDNRKMFEMEMCPAEWEDLCELVNRITEPRSE